MRNNETRTSYENNKKKKMEMDRLHLEKNTENITRLSWRKTKKKMEIVNRTSTKLQCGDETGKGKQ